MIFIVTFSYIKIIRFVAEKTLGSYNIYSVEVGVYALELVSGIRPEVRIPLLLDNQAMWNTMHENYMLYFICSLCLYFLVSSDLPLYCSDVIIKQNVEILQTITKTNFVDINMINMSMLQSMIV